MAVIYKGFDPNLGEQFLKDYNGCVILHGRSSPPASETPPDPLGPTISPDEAWLDEPTMPRGLTAQEQQDWEIHQWLKRQRAAEAARKTAQDAEDPLKD